MAIQWTEDLATGITEIDKQHKELYNRVNALLDATAKGKGQEEVAKVIDFLGDYVKSHFETEEKNMVKYDYPDYQSHKAQHTQFLSEFSDLKNKYEKDGVTSHLVVVVRNRVFDWLRNHIGKIDKALGGFLKNQMSQMPYALYKNYR